MTNPADSSVQNLLPVQAYFNTDGSFNTFIGQGVPFYATTNPIQSGLTITNSTLNSSPIGNTSPSTGVFTNISTTTGTISTAPSSATDIANKQYVDYYAAGLSWKQPVKAGSLANIASLSGFQTIDTVPLTNGDRVLVKDQSLSKDNGIYVVRSGAWEYAVGADDWQEYVGAIVFIEEGSQAYSAWYSLAQEGGTLGVTALDWANFSVSSTYSAGTGLTLLAGVFSITNTGVTNGSYGSASKTVTLAINAQGQATSASQQDIAIAGTQITSGTIDSARLSGSYSGITGLGTLGNLTVTNPISGSVTGSSASTTNLLGGVAGSLPYQTATNTTGFLAPSTDGYILSLASGVPSWIPNAVGTVTAVTASAPLASSGGSTPNITITQAGTASNGYLSSTDWNTFNGKANAGANSNITSMTGITGGISSPDYISFDTGYATTLTAGQLGWNGNDTLGLGMIGGNVIQHIGEDLYFYCKATSAITKGQVVMFTGAVGASGVPTGAPATGITDGTYIMGIAAESIALNGFGLIQSFGELRNVNTTGYVDGDILWYDPAVTGGLTKTKPVAPNVKVQMAAVINGGSAGGGTVLIRIDPGSTLGGSDSNAQITSPSNGQIITYDGGNQYWKNTALTAGTGISISSSANGVLTVASTVTGGLTITDNTSSASTYYPAITTATSGTITGATTSSTKLSFVPSTGVLSATGFSGSGSSLTGIVTSNVAGTGISVSGATGAVTITNSGVTSIVAGTGISISGGTGAVTVTNSSPGVTYTGGTGITISGSTIKSAPGAVVQTVQGVLTGSGTGPITSTTSSSYVSTGLTATITPTSASNKILVSYNLGSIYTASNGQEAFVTIYRNGTNISPVGTSIGQGFSTSFGNGAGMSTPHAVVYLDSPATTSATTYTIYYAVSPGTVYLGRNAPICTITLEEIAQ